MWKTGQTRVQRRRHRRMVGAWLVAAALMLAAAAYALTLGLRLR